jgi:hypothetical protein
VLTGKKSTVSINHFSPCNVEELFSLAHKKHANNCEDLLRVGIMYGSCEFHKEHICMFFVVPCCKSHATHVPYPSRTVTGMKADSMPVHITACILTYKLQLKDKAEKRQIFILIYSSPKTMCTIWMLLVYEKHMCVR